MKTEIEINIRGYHIDQFGHVNNARYLEFLEEGRWHYLETNGLIPVFHANNLVHSVVSIHINYRKAVTIGQSIRVETELLKKSPHSITMQQKLFLKDSKTIAADAEVTSVFLDHKSGRVIGVNNTLQRLWTDLSLISGNTNNY